MEKDAFSRFHPAVNFHFFVGATVFGPEAGIPARLILSRHSKLRNPLVTAVFGFYTILLVVGPLPDCCTVFTSYTKFRWSSAAFILAQGLPLTMLLFAGPLPEKPDRLKTKYVMPEVGP